MRPARREHAVEHSVAPENAMVQRSRYVKGHKQIEQVLPNEVGRNCCL